mmetsp:Transcript_692/g.894  ORF Transcript_692/g.894 Transcript_692/m.894 type:complete len:107 (-) Transcript_692:166-486(-)
MTSRDRAIPSIALRFDWLLQCAFDLCACSRVFFKFYGQHWKRESFDNNSIGLVVTEPLLGWHRLFDSWSIQYFRCLLCPPHLFCFLKKIINCSGLGMVGINDEKGN